MKKILITGITGFVGTYLAEKLISQPDNHVFGFYHSREPEGFALSSQNLFQVDLTHLESVTKAVAKIAPDEIYHLAAMSQGGGTNRAVINRVNVNGSENLIKACLELKDPVKLLLASTGYVYGSAKSLDQPSTEKDKPKPQGDYAQSKLAMEEMAQKYFKRRNLDIYLTRAFNHIGPRQTPDFVVASFAKQIAEIELKKSSPELKVGNLEAYRDFTDVRDVIDAYQLVLAECKPTEIYNIASGKAVTIQKVLDQLLTQTSEKIKITKDPARLRSSDIPISLGSFAKLEKATGWKPKIPLAKSLEDTLNYWRKVV